MARKEILTIKPNTLNLYSIYDVALVLFYIKAQYLASELTIKRYQGIILSVTNAKTRAHMGNLSRTGPSCKSSKLKKKKKLKTVKLNSSKATSYFLLRYHFESRESTEKT